MSSLLRLEQQQKRFLKIQFEVSYFSAFPVIIWNWNDKYVHTLSWLPQKPNPIPEQNRQSLYSFSDQNASKTLPFVAAHTYIAYLRKYPLAPPQGPGFVSQKKGEYWKGARRKRQSNWGIENEAGRLPLTPPPQSFAWQCFKPSFSHHPPPLLSDDPSLRLSINDIKVTLFEHNSKTF